MVTSSYPQVLFWSYYQLSCEFSNAKHLFLDILPMIIDTDLFCNNDFLPLQTPADLQAMGLSDPGTPVLQLSGGSQDTPVFVSSPMPA